jgi:hypothetical protein
MHMNFILIAVLKGNITCGVPIEQRSDLVVGGFGTAASAVHDAAVDLRNCVAGEGETCGGHGLLEWEVEGPATALADGIRRR